MSKPSASSVPCPSTSRTFPEPPHAARLHNLPLPSAAWATLCLPGWPTVYSPCGQQREPLKPKSALTHLHRPSSVLEGSNPCSPPVSSAHRALSTQSSPVPQPRGLCTCPLLGVRRRALHPPCSVSTHRPVFMKLPPTCSSLTRTGISSPGRLRKRTCLMQGCRVPGHTVGAQRVHISRQ